MNVSGGPYMRYERSEEFLAIKKPTQLCKDWSEFFRFATPHGRNTKGNGVEIFNPSTSDNIVRNIPHCSVNGWTTLTRSKPDHPLFHLPNSLEEDGQIQRSHDLVDVNPSVLNAVLFFQRGQRELQVLRTQRNSISFMRNFICKISLALQGEKNFEVTVLTRGRGGTSGADYSGENADSDLSENTQYPPFAWHLPKLGKVYAELRSCMKTYDDACNKWSQSCPTVVTKCKKLHQECLEYQGKMLLHVRWLIEARLSNIGRLVALQYENDGFDSDDVFCTNESKKFCKLIELYNEFTAKHLKVTGMTENELRIVFGDLTQAFTSVINSPYVQGLGETHSTVRAGVIYPLSVGKILDILSESFLEKVGFQVVRIFSKCGITQPAVLSKASNPPRKVTESGFLWEQASRIEIRPMHPLNYKSSFFRIIKRVAGISVPDIDTNEANKECAKLANWFKRHESVVSSFISGLGGKTKILRKSISLQEPYLSDDAMSITSSSSRASSSLTRHCEIKSVSWKDSWNNEAMKSITSSYLEFLASSIPHWFRKAECETADDKGIAVEKFSCKKDIDLILLQAVVSNLSCLNVMPENLHIALLNSSTELFISAALSCSDSLFCEMLGKTTPPFDKPTIQKDSDGTGLSLVSHLCIASLQPLLHLVESYAQNDTVARDVLPMVEMTLNAGFGWIKKKLREFTALWDFPALLQMCLCDLREITNIALDSLKLVETCHNHIETRRNQDSATLDLATKHLHNIDSLITEMQMASGSLMMLLGQETKAFTSQIIINHFPPQKFWVQKNMLDCEMENRYVQKIVETVLRNSCSAVSKMSLQCQLAGMTPIVNSVYEACLNHIAKLKMKFSVQGAMQLSYDFSTIINFVTADISGLSHETRTSLSCLHSVNRAVHVAQLLQSTSYEESTDERFRPPTTARSTASSTPDRDISDKELDDKFWLSLRKNNIKRSKTWSSLIPCMDEQ